MCIFLYTTTQFVFPSTYVQDGLSIISASESSMLNFMGTDYSNMRTTVADRSQGGGY